MPRVAHQCLGLHTAVSIDDQAGPLMGMGSEKLQQPSFMSPRMAPSLPLETLSSVSPGTPSMPMMRTLLRICRFVDVEETPRGASRDDAQVGQPKTMTSPCHKRNRHEQATCFMNEAVVVQRPRVASTPPYARAVALRLPKRSPRSGRTACMPGPLTRGAGAT